MINFTKLAKESGAEKVNLKLERHPVNASKQPTNFKVTKIVAYKTVMDSGVIIYNWNRSTIGRRSNSKSEWITTDRANYLILGEK